MLQARRVDAPAFVAHRFRIDRALGRGGSGEVCAAFDLVAQRSVALKLLRADRAGPEVDEALRSEFRILRGLSHPGIVRVFDFGRVEGVPFYTMELLSGGDLSAAIAGDGIDPHALLEHAAYALDYLHGRGLVHSDLKPSNVFRAGDRFVLTDFGLVQRTRDGKRDRAFGTVAYMPPERLGGGEPHAREDLYALGAILFEVLAGRPPFVGANPDATLAAILAGDLESELADVPEAWTRLLRRLLAKDPAARFESAWDLLQAWSHQFDRPLPAAPDLSPAFVGRRRELGQLRAAIADLARGRGALVAVTGRPGVGKSALLDAASAQATAAGVPCWRVEAANTPHAVSVVDALAGLYARWAPALPATAAAAAARLAHWPQALAAATTDEGALNVHASALPDLSAIAAAVPHVLVFDDAHRFDGASRSLLRFLAANAREAGVLVVVGTRGELGGDELLSSLRQAAQAGASVSILALRDLGADDVRALLQIHFGAGAEFETLCERILTLTRGHPFFVHETLQHLVTSGQLRRHSFGWEMAANAERHVVPRMADTILDEHMASAADGDRAAFEALSLFAAGTTATVLASVLGVETADARRSLVRGARGGLLTQQDDEFRFAHELIREACARRCPPSAAQRLHAAIASAVAGTAAEALHRLAAADATPAARTCYVREARAFLARRAQWDALRLYEAALDIDDATVAGSDDGDLVLHVAELRTAVGRSEDAAALLAARMPGPERPAARARYLHQLGEACRVQGRTAEALQHLQAAADLLRAQGDAAARHRCVADIARVLLARGDLAATIATCMAALDTMPGAAPLDRAVLLLLQAQAERQDGAYTDAETTCRRALELLKPLGRTRELAQTYTQIGTCHYYRRDYEQAERFYRTAVKVSSELENLHGVCGTLNNLAMTLVRAGRIEEAIGTHEKSLEIKRRLGDRPGQANSLNNLGNLWERRGDYRRALQCYRRGVSIYRRLDRPRELATLYNNMTEVCLRLGRFHAAARIAARAQALSSALPGSYIAQMVAYNTAQVHVLRMDPGAALEVLAAALPAVSKSALPDVLVRFHARFALAAAQVGDFATATHHMRAAGDFATPDTEPDARLDAALDLGEAALLGAHLDQSIAHLDTVIATAMACEQPWKYVRALRLRAECDLRAGDWDRAEARTIAAIEICRSKGFRSELAKCYNLSGSLHWEIGLRAQAESDFEQGIRLLEALNLRTELGLTYLMRARAAASKAI